MAQNLQKQVSNPSSTGGSGYDFETSVQSSFVVLMLANGVFPLISPNPISKIELQSRYRGINVDDITIHTTDGKNKMFGQIKQHLTFNPSDEDFKETINAAWLDFNNKENFNETLDKIVLITGPISDTDTVNVRNLLKNAKDSENANDFFNLRLKTKNFANSKQSDKLDAFKHCLKIANNGIDVTDGQLWKFLKSFNLLIYDIDIEGVCLSLLHTIIEQYSCSNSHSIWCQVKEFVRRKNIGASFITLEEIPEEIRNEFKIKQQSTIPDDFVKNTLKDIKFDDVKYIRFLAQANLIGNWDENSENDIKIVSEIVETNYNEWIEKLREIIQLENSPLNLKDGVWRVENREELLDLTKSFIYDKDLNNFKSATVKVLKESDPKLELEKGQRFAASIYGKQHPYSYSLRKGVSETLALLGCNSSKPDKTSSNKTEQIITLTIREIFDKSSWQLWAGLSDFLPLIAEASPREFLDAISDSLKSSPNSFLELFAQEGDGISGCNYMVGLLWALETLAWSPTNLVDVTLTLAELASIDPGGQWANRPINSLVEIFMPWHTQTVANIEQQQTAIATLVKENPNIAWKLLVSLIPKSHQAVGDTAKPKFANYIPEDWEIDKKRKSYNEKVSFYVQLLIEQTKNNIDRMILMVDNLDVLSDNDFDKMIRYMSDSKILAYEEDKRKTLWQELKKLADHHKRYNYTDWAMSSERIEKLEKIAKLLEPKDLINLYAPLFNIAASYAIEETEEKDYEKAFEKLSQKRIEALKIILSKNSDFTQILKLLNQVKNPHLVASELVKIDKYSFDSVIFPNLLTANDGNIIEFINNYVYHKYFLSGIEWIKSLNILKWKEAEQISFFKMLPFIPEIWDELEELSKTIKNKYWQEINVSPYQHNTDLNRAIENLLSHNRPIEAIDCLYKRIYDKEPVENSLIVKVLNMIDPSDKNINRMDYYHVKELIQILQKDPNVNQEELFLIEWKFFRILSDEVQLVTLENKIKSSPDFFCELISLAYKSDNPDYKVEPDTMNKNVIEQAWEILHELRPLAGLNEKKEFDIDIFMTWFEKVVKISTQTGHLGVALTLIGHILFYTPADKDGFWINRDIAELLNKKEYDDLRQGYRTEIINSRGVHWVDPTAKPENELAEKYRQQAEDCKKSTFHRFAIILEDAAKSYDREAERILNNKRYD